MTADADTRWMRRALRLARRGQGRTSPNPMVGAVIVKSGQLIGEGHHKQVGGPHAEIRALRDAGEKARGATMYVSLEPCSHHGRTPPCTDALIQAGLARVIAAVEDPNPQVSGNGIRKLQEAGIEVQVGLLADAARRLNAPYFKHTTTGLPLVSLKAAMSLDGKIATSTGESRWITGDKARALGHRLRAIHDAVLAGVGTVLADDPQLTVRNARGRTPLRVIVDSRARTPADAALLTADAIPPIIAVTHEAPRKRLEALRKAGAEIWEMPSLGGFVDLRALMKRLGERQVQSVLVESGGT
ncbi:MAG TPA: bifunctional diaminohydroxyphosphoribosylaminopyrimidine deaminase/5-amino-6-(5-phosphoribosylamino)uracil reductase RibD, partial [Phycisphaerae bacterium]|nr:bifunctional diaminohydroxyphosphoribosylaminopyrimidine deaminase/5-amino-6-(5-phosphoribosylamino)uracil reductase RibD [Phycisphaerae bacterium]